MTNAFFYNLVSCNTVTSGYNILFNNAIRGWKKNSTAPQTKFTISTQLNTFYMLPSLRYKEQRKQFYICFNYVTSISKSYIYTLSHRLCLKIHKTARLDDGTYNKKKQKFHFSI